MLNLLVAPCLGHKTSNVLDNPIAEEDEEPLDSSSHDTSPDPPERRRNLPARISDMADFSLWSLLRKNIGETQIGEYSQTPATP